MTSKLLDEAAGMRMELPAYYANFEKYFRGTREFWKLESGQTFAEPGDESWQAFNRGDWNEAIRLAENRREDLAHYHQQNASRGTATRRIRIVSLPPTPYLHWELYLLKIRDETGGPIRILPSNEVTDLTDRYGPLPDIYTMDSRVMYQAIYDENGVLEYALKYTDKHLIDYCHYLIAGLYYRGEPISSFFAREIAHLPPPQHRTTIPADYLERTGRPYPIRS